VKAESIARHEQNAADERRRLRRTHEEHLAGLKKTLNSAICAEKEHKAESGAEKQKVQKENAVAATEQFQVVREKQAKMTEADTAFNSFSNLVNLMQRVGSIVTAPLRYVIRVLGEPILDIRKVDISGKFGKRSGKITAHIEGTIGFVWQSFDLQFDVGNVVSFFDGLWEKVKEIISSIGGMLQNIVRQGKEAVQRFVEEVKQGIKHVVDTTSRFFDNTEKTLKEVGKNIEEGFDDIREKTDEGLTDIGPDTVSLVRDIDRGLQNIDPELQNVARNIGRSLEDVGRSFSRLFINHSFPVIGAGGYHDMRMLVQEQMSEVEKELQVLKTNQEEREKEFARKEQKLRIRNDELYLMFMGIDVRLEQARQDILQSYIDRYGPTGADFPECAHDMLNAEKVVESQRIEQRRLVRQLDADVALLTLQYTHSQKNFPIQISLVLSSGQDSQIVEINQALRDEQRSFEDKERVIHRTKFWIEREYGKDFEGKEYRRKEAEMLQNAHSPRERKQVDQKGERARRSRQERYAEEDQFDRRVSERSKKSSKGFERTTMSWKEWGNGIPKNETVELYD
jgi:hypothetical protein